MVDFPWKERYDLDDFRRVIAILRHPGGCPWDQAQDHHSIRRNFIEEVYEACEAIDTEDPVLLREELGDVLMQVLFHASMEEDAGRFTVDDVADTAVKKLIFRHPHVFGQRSVSGVGQVLENWDELKREEKGQRTETDTLNAVARSLPALWRAEKVQKKAARAGFAWPEIAGALDKLDEEARELREAVSGGGDSVEELGDLLFAAVNAARYLDADPEEALHRATEKFIARFGQMEALAAADGSGLRALSTRELAAYWQRAKEMEKETAHP